MSREHNPLVDFDEKLALRASAFNVIVCLLGFLQGSVCLVNEDLKLLVLDQIEEFGAVPFEVTALVDVWEESRARQLDVLFAESENVDRVDGARLLDQVSISPIRHPKRFNYLTAFPKETRLPLRATIFKASSKVALPMPSKTASIP